MSERRGHFYVVKHRFKADEIRSIKWPGPVDSETIVHLLNMCYYDEPEEEKKNDNLYRKKPIVVEAFQTDEEMLIETLEGTMKAEKGDFIIKGVRGELYPCKEDIFHETYEKVYEKSNHQNNYCTDCKHCIGEPTILVSEDTGLWAMAYSCLGGNPKKKGMFTCKERACEFFEEGVKC